MELLAQLSALLGIGTILIPIFVILAVAASFGGIIEAFLDKDKDK